VIAPRRLQADARVDSRRRPRTKASALKFAALKLARRSNGN
jgi:hypothetical protein